MVHYLVRTYWGNAQSLEIGLNQAASLGWIVYDIHSDYLGEHKYLWTVTYTCYGDRPATPEEHHAQ